MEHSLPHDIAAAPLPAAACLRVVYVGHATLLVQFPGCSLLTDPNFDSRLAYLLPRVSPPGIALAALPPLQAVLVTHAHADHLSLRSLRQLHPPVPVLAPPTVSSWLRRAGFSSVWGIAPGEVLKINEIRVTALAALHSGARYGLDRWRREANMYLIMSPDASCFFAGDTALSNDLHLRIREHLGSRTLDIALLPIGHPPWWKRNSFRRGHLTPTDALLLFQRLEAQYLIPFHWGVFTHVTSGAHDAIRQFRTVLPLSHRRDDVRILEPGMAFELTCPHTDSR